MLSGEEIVNQRNKMPPDFPTIGYKLFEPENSTVQAQEIKDSLEITKELISYERVKIIGSLSKATWDPTQCLAVVTHQSGSYWSTMGHVVDGRLSIYPEEALYLLEIAALELTYEGVPLSIERAYAVLLEPQTDVTIGQYRVYSQLNAHGYKVLRHSSKNVFTRYEKHIELHKVGLKQKDYITQSSKKRESDTLPSQTTKKSISKYLTNLRNLPIHFKENDDMSETLEKLKIIESGCEQTSVTSKIHYDVYLSSRKNIFKKSKVQLPKFRIRICRSDGPAPEVNDIADLSKSFEDDVPIIYAIVFPDFVSFYSLTPVDLPSIT